MFTLGISGIFSAHDLATGKLLWRKNAPPTPPEFGTASSPMVDGSNVIAFLGGNGAGALTAMDAATGDVKWRWTGDGPGYASPIIATIAGTRQIITQSQNKLVGVAAADGTAAVGSADQDAVRTELGHAARRRRRGDLRRPRQSDDRATGSPRVSARDGPPRRAGATIRCRCI